jgi:hypothetical protein
MQPKAKTSVLSAAAKAALAVELPVIEAALERLLPVFDREANECTCCGLRYARSFADLQAFEVVSGMLTKAHRLRR